MTINKKIVYPIISAVLLFSASFVFAEVKLDPPIKFTDFGKLITDGIIPAVTAIIGALSTVMFIVAGILFLTSAGSPEKMNKAKTALYYAIAGTAIALAASAIAGFIQSVVGAK
jgi:hypothetical protein